MTVSGGEWGDDGHVPDIFLRFLTENILYEVIIQVTSNSYGQYSCGLYLI